MRHLLALLLCLPALAHAQTTARTPNLRVPFTSNEKMNEGLSRIDEVLGPITGGVYDQANRGKVFDAGGQVFNVKAPNFGARCDGTTDDVAAIEKALATACSAGRGTVLIPGACGITDAIDWPTTCNNVTLAGTGPGSRLVNVAGADVSRGMILADWTGHTQATRIVIRDLDLVGGTSLSAAFKRGVQVKNCAKCAVKNLTITGVDGNPSTGSDVYGIELRDDVTDAEVSGNTIVFATTTSSDTSYKIGILVRSAMVDDSNGNITGATPLPATTKRTRVYGNSVYGGTHGINCQNVEDLDIVGNVLQSQGHRGMGLGGTSRNITVTGNTVRDSGSVNLLFAGGATNVTVVGNTLDTTVGGENANIQMYYTIDHATVAGNNLYNANYGVRVQYDARDVQIVGNNILSTASGGRRGIGVTGAMTSGYTDTVYAGASISDIVIANNQIRLGTSGIGIYLLGQETGTVQGTVNISDVTVRGNVIDGSTSTVGITIAKNSGAGTLTSKVEDNTINAPTKYSTDFANFIDAKEATYSVSAADNGTGTQPTIAITPQFPQINVSCEDTNGCVGANSGSISESIANVGDKVTIVSTGTYAITISDVAGLTELAGDWTGGTYDTLSLLYTGTRWVETGRSNN